jgi:hypothetical protein
MVLVDDEFELGCHSSKEGEDRNGRERLVCQERDAFRGARQADIKMIMIMIIIIIIIIIKQYRY